MKWITVNGPRTYVGPYQDLYDAIQTPSLYMIDDKKKIIAKKVPAEKLEEFFAQYEKFQKTKAVPPKAPANCNRTHRVQIRTLSDFLSEKGPNFAKKAFCNFFPYLSVLYATIHSLESI